MGIREALLGILIGVIWGLNFVVIDVGLDGVPPLLFAAVRFALVGALAVVVARPAAPTWRIVGVGLCMSAGQFGLLYTAMAAGFSPGLAALVLQAQVPFTILIAAAVLHERLSGRQYLGLVLAMAGLACVGLARGGSVTLAGFVLLLGAAVSWACGNVIARGIKASGLSSVVWSALAAPLPLLAASALVEGPQSWLQAAQSWGLRQTGSTLYTVLFATLVGYSLWNRLLSRHPAGSVVPFALLAPVVALLAAWSLLGENPTGTELLGGAVLGLGAAMIVMAGAGQSRASASRSCERADASTVAASARAASRPSGPTGTTASR